MAAKQIRTTKKPSPMAGVEFADEVEEAKGTQVVKTAPPPAVRPPPVDPKQVDVPPIQDSDMMAANQAAARRALETIKKRPRLQEIRQAPVELPPPDPEVQAKIQAKRYMVTKGGKVFRSGNSYTLFQGKVINNNEYDIEKLLSLGIGLEELPAT